MSARVESAVLRLYEDPGLRDELTDDEATPMLKWAEGEVAGTFAANRPAC